MLFILCLLVALALSASAESANKLTYAVGASASTVSANTEFTILVEVTENTGICWFKSTLYYDSSVLTFVSADTSGSAFPSDSVEVNKNIKTSPAQAIITMGEMSVIMQDNPTIYKNTGVLAVLKFQVNESAPAGTTTIKLVAGDSFKIVNGEWDSDYTINTVTETITVVTGNHATCTPGTAKTENNVAATCTVDGGYDTVTRCTECNKVITSKHTVVPKLGHKEGEPVNEGEVAATCISVGHYQKVVKCTVCGVETLRETVIIPANDKHTPGEAVKENVVSATCKTAGSYDSVVYCVDCRAEISRTTQTIAKGDHVPGNPEVTVTDPTCTKKGSLLEIYKCSACGIELERKTSELDVVDHKPGSTVKENEIAATCTSAGSYTSVVYCTVCNTKLTSEAKTTEKLPHTSAPAVQENRKEPVNCGADGTYDSVVYCTVCKAETSRVPQTIPAPDHTPGPVATETTPQICTVCNKVLVAALDHTHKWESKWTSDNSGHWYACSGCPEKKDPADHSFDNTCDAECNICGFTRVPADHVYGNWTIVNEATAAADGLRQRSCIICGHVISETIPATGEVTTEPSTDVTTEQNPDVSGPETSEPDVTTESAPGTDSESVPGTTAPDATEPGDETDKTDPDDGCGSVVSMGIALIAILGTALIMKKRD